MNRQTVINELRSPGRTWDILVIGGGATGMATALDAASRGYSTLLLEQHDFGKGTSSRSTKLIHGGVRYLKQGDVSLVLEALRERGMLLSNAPHLVRDQSFVIPAYNWWESPFYVVGLKLYDAMAGRMGLERSRHLSRKGTLDALPNVEPGGLKGGITYHDGQFDDSRLLMSMARTCWDYGGFPVNYIKVTGLSGKSGRISGVTARDEESGEEFSLKTRAVVNATGVFADEILRMESPDAPGTIRPSQGIHLVVDEKFLPGPNALMVPSTSDGRVMFAVPWHNRVVLGTTDTPVEETSLEPRPLDREIDFVLSTAGRYLVKKPGRRDILSAFAGLRPLAAPQKPGKASKEISRGHKILVSASGMISVIGGKWTTCRKMAEDAVDQAIRTGGLPGQPCRTRNLRIHGFTEKAGSRDSPMHVYGTDRAEMEELEFTEPGALHGSAGAKEPDEGHKTGNENYLSESLQIRKSQIPWAVRMEMARTLEDVLARRTRALFLDARESMAMAPEAARMMAAELGRDGAWIRDQLENYRAVAEKYLVDPGRQTG